MLGEEPPALGKDIRIASTGTRDILGYLATVATTAATTKTATTIIV
jgi:hypothetical protein